MNNKLISGLLLIFIILFSLAISQYINILEEGLINASRNIPIVNGMPVISEGYYKISDGMMAPVPYGYIAKPDKSGILPKSQNAIQNIDDIDAQISAMTELIRNEKNPLAKSKLQVKLDLLNAQKINDGYAAQSSPAADAIVKDSIYSTNLIDTNKNDIYNDIEYHTTDVSQLTDAKNAYGDDAGTAYVYDKDGNKIAMARPKVQGSITYYQPNTYEYGASTYVPNYEDSVYLSRTTGLSQVGKIKQIPNYQDKIYSNLSTGLSQVATYNNAKNESSGACEYHKQNPEKLEEICQKTKLNNCGSMSCCVLLGGDKCVSGNKKGPTSKVHYSDIYVKNRDYYYHQGNCYGNCP